MMMTPEKIVKRLRDIVYDNEFDAEAGFAAADLIEQQAKALEEAEEFLAANKKRMHDRGVVPFSRTELVLESIRAARGEKENG